MLRIKNIKLIGMLLGAFLLVFCGKRVQVQQKDRKTISKVVILGNSIVAHPPKAEIGWTHDWGMAASCAKCDFVHILQDSITRTNPDINVEWGSIAEFEQDYTQYDVSKVSKYRDADLLIIKISENVTYSSDMEEEFIQRFDHLVDYLTPSKKTTIVIAEGFWPSPVNALLKDYAIKNKYLHVPIEDLFASDKRNAAIGLFENEGVANHPSDFGMKNIAERIWHVIYPLFQ